MFLIVYVFKKIIPWSLSVSVHLSLCLESLHVWDFDLLLLLKRNVWQVGTMQQFYFYSYSSWFWTTWRYLLTKFNYHPWNEDRLSFKVHRLPWPVWLSWLSVISQSERSLVWFPVGCSWGVCTRQPTDVSPPLFLSPFPSV